jgi:hypothetical protein
MRNAHRLFLFFLALLAVLSACDSTEPAENDAGAPVVSVKQLVTVEIPPTANAVEREATRQAMPTTPTDPPPTVTPTPTPYIGVFLGEYAGDQNLPPMIDVPATAIGSDQVAGNCTVEIDPVFGEGWRGNPSVTRRMGCAIQERFGFNGSVQVFERGVMYLRQDTGEVWAIQPATIDRGRYWYVNNLQPITITDMAPPEGLRVPQDIFGAVWLSDAQIRDALGYARTPEQVAEMNVQRYDGGTLFLDVTISQAFVLLVNGDAFGPY